MRIEFDDFLRLSILKGVPPFSNLEVLGEVSVMWEMRL